MRNEIGSKCPAIDGWIVTSRDRIAIIECASVGIAASEIGVVAAFEGSAEVSGTSVEVVADFGHFDGEVEASASGGITSIDGACVLVVAVFGREDA